MRVAGAQAGRWALAALLAVTLVGCPDGTGGDPGDPGRDAGTAAPSKTASALLENARGKVTIERGGKKGPAQLGYLYVGDALETGDESEAVVRFAGGRVIELGPEGRFELKEGEGGLVLSVAQGLVLTRNETAPPSKPLGNPVQVTLLTLFGFTRLGTTDESELTLTVDAKGAKVDVKLGGVELVSSDGKVTQIGAGKTARLGELKELNLDPIDVIINAGAGRAELKRKDDKAWAPLAKKTIALSEGDSFRVKDGRIVMQAPDGQGQLTFARGSEVTMEKARKSATAEETGFDFKKGELSAVSPVKQKLNLSGGVSLTSDKGSQFTLRRTKEGYELVSSAGDVKIERDGQEPSTVFGGRTATIPLKGAVKSEEPSREQVLLPSRSALKVLGQAGRLAITWEGEPEKPYRVELATDPAYKQKLVSGVVHQRFLNVQAPPRGSLYWHVFDEGDKEVAKGSASFAPEAGQTDLARVRNEVPEANPQTVIFFQDKPPAVTFTWAANAEAAKYKVQVFRKGDLKTPVADKSVSEDRLLLPEGALGEGEYLWSLSYLDAKGTEVGSAGAMKRLLITYDNAVQGLTIRSPKNGDPGGPKVRCQGVAPIGAKVQINGKPVQLDEKSRFDTEVAPMGAGLLVFRMVNGASEVYTVRKVRRGK
ncbi:MAG: hypothetical protein IPJ65_32090 [Archangiaceae bacterium]|nr:hypothetical protein [Archangiaceae bacterium]